MLAYEDHANLIIIDTIQKTIKIIETELPNQKLRFAMNDSLLAICTDSEEDFGEAMETTIKIYCNNSTKLLLKENFNNFIGFSTDSLGSKSLIIVILTDKIIIISNLKLLGMPGQSWRV